MHETIAKLVIHIIISVMAVSLSTVTVTVIRFSIIDRNWFTAFSLVLGSFIIYIISIILVIENINKYGAEPDHIIYIVCIQLAVILIIAREIMQREPINTAIKYLIGVIVTIGCFSWDIYQLLNTMVDPSLY